MSIFKELQAPLSWLEGEAKSIIPPDLLAEIGALFSSTFAHSLVHDAGSKAHTITHDVVASVWAALKQTATTLYPQVLANKVTLKDAVGAGVTALKSGAASVMLPALANVKEQTIVTWLTPLITSALATSNPTSQPVSSQQGSSPASSRPL